MIDPEVARLRRLRDAALSVRAATRALAVAGHADSTLLERIACASWRVARAACGRLIAHPYPSYQRGPALRQVLADALRARAIALAERRRSGVLAVAHRELLALCRVVDDVRALTLASDLSDTLGRAQWELTGLIDALERARAEGAHDVRTAARPAIVAARSELVPSVGGDWPYLAL